MPLHPPTEEDLVRFKRFNKRVAKVLSRRALVNDEFPTTIRWSKGNDLEVRPVDEELRDSLATAFRPFTLQKDPESFPRVLGRVGWCIRTDLGAALCRRWKARWRRATVTGEGFPISIKSKLGGEEIDITPEVMLNLWFYGGLFHGDNEDHVRKMERIEASASSRGMFDAMLGFALGEALEVLFEVHQVTEHMVKTGAPPQMVCLAHDGKAFEVDLETGSGSPYTEPTHPIVVRGKFVVKPPE